LWNGAAGHCENRSATGHGFYHHQAKGLVPLDREQHRHGVAEQFILRLEIGEADVLHQLSVDLWLDLSLEIFTVHGLNVTGNLEGDSSALRHINGNVSPLERSYSADKAEVRLFVLDQFILNQINAMVDRVHPGHGLLFALRVTDADVLDLWIEA